MEVVKQITQEQLQTIIGQQKDLQTLLTNVGVVESQKHAFLHQIGELNKAIEDFKISLENEYGPISINLEDGSYTKVEVEGPVSE